MSTQQLEQHAKEIVLSAAELAILSYLRSLSGQRTTFRRIGAFVGVTERVAKEHVKSLREKGFWIVSNKDKDNLGTFITDNPRIWNDYVERRLKESQSINLSISKM